MKQEIIRLLERAKEDGRTIGDVLAEVRGIAEPVAAQAQGAAGDARADRDAAFEAVRKRLCALPRYSFWNDDNGGVKRVNDRSGNWIEFDAAHELFDPICVDAAMAPAANGDALDSKRLEWIAQNAWALRDLENGRKNALVWQQPRTSTEGGLERLRSAIDAAIAAQQGEGGGA
ncbi:hypothetical protein ACLQ9J_04310 [Bordetella hinzii]|uniref:hypothetical protein n=1 Tax=Bordetella hinzii TaxID=103855 RepID=UPI0039FC9127